MTRSLSVEDKGAELYRKIVQWKRVVQPIYMPGLRVSSDDGEEDTVNQSAEDGVLNVCEINLNLPSSLSIDQQMSACVPGLLEKEHCLRLAQAEDSLVELRRALRTQSTLHRHQRTQTAGAGVAANTRMQSLIAKHKLKEVRLAEWYRAARDALLSLDPEGDWKTRLQDLCPQDVRPPFKLDGEGEGTRTQTWIWLMGAAGLTLADLASIEEGAIDPTAGELDEGLRVEWAKSLARVERWEEELILVPIEMTRVLCNLVHKARWWQETAAATPARSQLLKSGYMAYAEKQAHVFESLAYSFSSLWLQLFAEHGLPEPLGWPQTCRTIQFQSTHGVVRRRHRMKLRIRALALEQEERDAAPT